MRRRTFLLTMGGAAAAAGTRSRPTRSSRSSTCSPRSPPRSATTTRRCSSKRSIPACRTIDDFRRDVVALTDVANLTNSIEVLSDTGDDTHRAEELDWFLEMVSKSDPHPVERRREVVKFRLERKGKNKKWKIVSIDPLHFFAPPKFT